MYYIGVDLGGTNIAVGIVDAEHRIIAKGSVPTKASRHGDEIVHDMAELISSLLKKNGIQKSEVESVGIAAPGIADRSTGNVVYSCNLPFVNYPLADKLSEFSGISKVYIENDANAAALGEAIAGAARGSRNSVMITLGTGVGGGIIIDGKVYSGFNFAAAELGHIVIEKGGKLCGCGRRGCWEAYSSATGLTAMTNEKIAECRSLKIPSLMVTAADKGERTTARTAFNAAKQGDIPAKEVVDKYVSYLACGLTNIINIFQPDVLCLGGGVSGEGDYLIDLLTPIINHEQYTRDLAVKTKIRIASLGNDAGIVGAAALGL